MAVIFAGSNFSVEYKPVRPKVVADALSRRPDFQPTAQINSRGDPTVASLYVSTPLSSLLDDVRKSYTKDEALLGLMSYLSNPSRQAQKRSTSSYRSSADRYADRVGLLYYTAINGDALRVVVPTHNDLRLRIMYECHDAPPSGHRGREKTYLAVGCDFNWPRQYDFVRRYICSC